LSGHVHLGTVGCHEYYRCACGAVYSCRRCYRPRRYCHLRCVLNPIRDRGIANRTHEAHASKLANERAAKLAAEPEPFMPPRQPTWGSYLDAELAERVRTAEIEFDAHLDSLDAPERWQDWEQPRFDRFWKGKGHK
jgi:hypothetical protein